MNMPNPMQIAQRHDNRLAEERAKVEQQKRSKATWYRLHYSELVVGDIFKFKPDGAHHDVLNVQPSTDDHTGVEYRDGKKTAFLTFNKPFVLCYMKGRK